MTDGMRAGLIVLGLALLVGTSFVASRYWQASQHGYERVAASAGCDLRAGPCAQDVAGGRLMFAIEPSDIPLMQPLTLRVETDGLAPADVVIEIRGLNMDMGLNRTRLSESGAGRWEGETILPVCSRRRMEWEAAVQIDADGRFEVPFVFHTTRP